MCEANFRLVALLRDVERDRRAVPLGLVFNEVQGTVEHESGDRKRSHDVGSGHTTEEMARDARRKQT